MVWVRQQATLDILNTTVLFPYHCSRLLLTFPSYIAAIAAAGSLLGVINHRKGDRAEEHNGFGRVNVGKRSPLSQSYRRTTTAFPTVSFC